MNRSDKILSIEFPLRGEWISPNTPGKKVPSHGTDQLGTRYAYDFLQVDWKRKGHPSYSSHWLHYLIFGVPIEKCYCWGKEIYSPFDGIVVEAKDGYIERRKSHLISDLIAYLRNIYAFNKNKNNIQLIAGNYVIIQYSNDIYSALVHLQNGSVKVTVGQNIKKGDIIGNIGHSGNSFSPHLHFQLMDSNDILNANGLSCAFKQYELFKNDKWIKIYNGIPTNKDRIRFNP